MNTPNFDFILPGVNDPTDQDLWGGYLNENFESLDDILAVYETLSKSANYTVVEADANNLIQVDATGGTVTISLPASASVRDGFSVTIKKVDPSGNAVTIDPNASELIDGDATYTLSGENDSVLIAADGTGWKIIAYKTTPSAVSDASTSAKGIIQIATDAEAITGTDTAKAIVPSSLAAVLAGMISTTAASSGKIVLDDVTIQWGSGNLNSGATVTYGTPFSQKAWTIIAINAGSSVRNTNVQVDLAGSTASQFSIPSTGNNDPFCWIAIGAT